MPSFTHAKSKETSTPHLRPPTKETFSYQRSCRSPCRDRCPEINLAWLVRGSRRPTSSNRPLPHHRFRHHHRIREDRLAREVVVRCQCPHGSGITRRAAAFGSVSAFCSASIRSVINPDRRVMALVGRFSLLPSNSVYTLTSTLGMPLAVRKRERSSAPLWWSYHPYRDPINLPKEG